MQLAAGLAGNAATGRHLHHDHHPGRWFHAPAPLVFLFSPLRCKALSPRFPLPRLRRTRRVKRSKFKALEPQG
jgi:hypothetical protein